MAAAADDPDVWARDAFLDSRLAAAVLLTLRQRSLTEPEAEDDEKPSTSVAVLPEWGRRVKRARMMRLPRIVSATEEEEGAEEKRKEKRRASPHSPLEGYSTASASGGEEGTSSSDKPVRAQRSPGLASAAAPEDCRTKVVANRRAPSIPASAPIRRPASRKMTKPELQAVERALLEERAKLRKEMEEWRRAVEELRVDNRKLKMHLELPKVPITPYMVLEDVQLPGLCQPVQSSSLPGDKVLTAIPDLNDPLPDC